MSFALIPQLLATLALIFAILEFGRRLHAFSRLPRPVDKAIPKGSPQTGVLYAYTLGMAPWSKEATRRHALAYLRGVVFHLGIFLGLAVLLASPWITWLPDTVRISLALCAAVGALFGYIGLVARFSERNLRSLSTHDDYFAVLIVSVFLSAEALWLVVPQARVFFYLVSAMMLVYAPLGKIRHCIYFAYSRLFYGKFVGIRAVLPHSQQGAR